MRVGIGYDIHRLATGRRLVLGGVTLEHEQGLVGHSDADVLVHAVCDALLGAMADGDIGSHFPDDDPRYRDIESTELLRDVCQRMKKAGYEIGNLDCTVVAEEPRISPHVQSMRKRLADVLSTDVSRVSVKAKRGEGVGPAGRKEAMEALAIVYLEETAE